MLENLMDMKFKSESFFFQIAGFLFKIKHLKPHEIKVNDWILEMI